MFNKNIPSKITNIPAPLSISSPSFMQQQIVISPLSPISPVVTPGTIAISPSLSPISVNLNKLLPSAYLHSLKLGPWTVVDIDDIFIPSFKVISDLRVPVYDDVCDTSEIKELVCKIFYDKLLRKWLYDIDESGYVFKYLKMVDGKVSLIKNLENTDDYKSNSQTVIDKKVDFIEENILKIEDIAKILTQFVKGTGISWCKLTKNSSFIREALEKSLVNKMKKLINGKDED